MADRTVVYKLQAEIGQFRAQMAQAGASTKKLATDMTAMDASAVKTRRGLDTVGSAAGKFALVAAAGIGAAVLKAANFDEAMSGVQAATHESTVNMERLRDAALEAGARTAFSATEAADGIEQLAKAGVATTDILSGGLAGALDLAAAGELEVGDAAEIAATALTQFKLEGADVAHVADLLAAGAGKAQGDVSDLGMALKQSGLVASQTGLSIEETAGTLSAFASAGLIGSDAGTSFKTMLQSLTPSGEKAAKEMERLGISAYDAQGNFIGMAEFAGVLQQALAGLSVEQQNAALKTIFGSDAVRAASVLYQQGATGIQEWIDKTNDAGFAAETAATRLDNLKGDLEELGGSLETALIGTGEGSQGALRGLVQTLTDVVNAYNSLSPSAQSATGVLLAGSAALGGSIWVGTKLIRGIADTRQAFDNLGLSGSKTAGVLGRVGWAAGHATAAIAVLGTTIALTAESDAVAGVEATEKAIRDLGDGSDAAKAKIDALFTRTSSSFMGDKAISGLADAFDAIDTGKLAKLWSDPIFQEAEWDLARESIEALDVTMSNLVTSGDTEAASAMFDYFAEKAKDAGLSSAEAAELLPGYQDALVGLENDTRATADATGDLSGAQQKASKVTQVNTERIKAQKEALEEQREAATTSAESFVNLGDSLDNGKKSLHQWLNELERQAEALANFRQNSKKAAKEGLDKGLIRALQDAGEEGALRMQQLANASEDEIERANDAWRKGRGEIGKYVDATVKVPKKKSTWVTVDSSDAMEELRKFEDMLDKATEPRSARLALTLLMDATGDGYQTRGGIQRKAQGGYISGPGSATSDSIPAWLSNGEFVIKAAAVQRYGPDFFHQLNAMRFADGGMVSRAPAAPVVNVSGGAQLDYARLANELARVRPMYGDVHISGDPTTFRKQMQRDKQVADLGGF